MFNCTDDSFCFADCLSFTKTKSVKCFKHRPNDEWKNSVKNEILRMAKINEWNLLDDNTIMDIRATFFGSKNEYINVEGEEVTMCLRKDGTFCIKKPGASNIHRLCQNYCT